MANKDNFYSEPELVGTGNYDLYWLSPDEFAKRHNQKEKIVVVRQLKDIKDIEEYYPTIL